MNRTRLTLKIHPLGSSILSKNPYVLGRAESQSRNVGKESRNCLEQDDTT